MLRPLRAALHSVREPNADAFSTVTWMAQQALPQGRGWRGLPRLLDLSPGGRGLVRTACVPDHAVSRCRTPIVAWLLKSRFAFRQESIDAFAELVTAEGDGLRDGLALEKVLDARLVGAFHHHLAHGEHCPWSRGNLLRRSKRLGHELVRGNDSIAEANRRCLVGAIAPVQHDHLLGPQATDRPGQRLEQ